MENKTSQVNVVACENNILQEDNIQKHTKEKKIIPNDTKVSLEDKTLSSAEGLTLDSKGDRGLNFCNCQYCKGYCKRNLK